MAAYTEVLEALQRRDERGHGRRLRGALSEAANPAVAIAEIRRGGPPPRSRRRLGGRAVRGEAVTAAVLAEAVVRTAIPLIELNLAGAAGAPRRIGLMSSQKARAPTSTAR